MWSKLLIFMLPSTCGWPEDELLTFAEEMTRILAICQERNIKHRDIKPSNIFLCKKGFKLGDFGAARWANSSSTCTATLIGTPIYFSYELRDAMEEFQRSREPRKRLNWIKSDMNSLGFMLLNMARLDESGELNNRSTNQ